MLQAKERTPILSPFVVFTFRLAIKFIKELGGVLGWAMEKIND